MGFAQIRRVFEDRREMEDGFGNKPADTPYAVNLYYIAYKRSSLLLVYCLQYLRKFEFIERLCTI